MDLKGSERSLQRLVIAASGLLCLLPAVPFFANPPSEAAVGFGTTTSSFQSAKPGDKTSIVVYSSACACRRHHVEHEPADGSAHSMHANTTDSRIGQDSATACLVTTNRDEKGSFDAQLPTSGRTDEWQSRLGFLVENSADLITIFAAIVHRLYDSGRVVLAYLRDNSTSAMSGSPSRGYARRLLLKKSRTTLLAAWLAGLLYAVYVLGNDIHDTARDALGLIALVTPIASATAAHLWFWDDVNDVIFGTDVAGNDSRSLVFTDIGKPRFTTTVD